MAIYFSAFLISQFGKWLNGAASTKSIVRVIVYASIPTIISLSIVLLKVILYGKRGLSSFDGRLDLTSVQSMLWLALGFLQILLALWSFILLLVGVSEAQQFSKAKAFINIFFPAILLGVLFGAIVVIGFLK